MSSAKIIKNKEQRTEWISELLFNQLPKIKEVAFIKDEIAFVLDDERIVYIPLSWSKKLHKANIIHYDNNFFTFL